MNSSFHLLGAPYVSIVPYRIEQEKFMSLNAKLKTLTISLSFWIRLVLGFVFKTHYTSKGPMFLPNNWYQSPSYVLNWCNLKWSSCADNCDILTIKEEIGAQVMRFLVFLSSAFNDLTFDWLQIFAIFIPYQEKLL